MLQLLLKNRTSLFSSLILQTSYISSGKNGVPKCKDVIFRLTWIFSLVYATHCTRPKKLQHREAEAAAAWAMKEDMAGSWDSTEPELQRAKNDWWCLRSNCPLIPKETESFCYFEFQCGQFLLNAVTDASPKRACVCITIHDEAGEFPL